MSGQPCTVRLDAGKTVTFDGIHISNVAEIWFRRVYFAIPGFALHENDTVVDLGANAGVFSVAAAACGCHVIAVEAQPVFAPVIQANARANRCEQRIVVITGLVGPKTGVFSDPATLKSSFHDRQHPRALTMDEIVRRFKLTVIDFLKVDIEGSEFDLFSSDAHWFSLVRSISMEIHTSFGSVTDLLKRLQEEGFSTWLLNNELESVDHLDAASGYLYAKRIGVSRIG